MNMSYYSSVCDFAMEIVETPLLRKTLFRLFRKKVKKNPTKSLVWPATIVYLFNRFNNSL